MRTRSHWWSSLITALMVGGAGACVGRTVVSAGDVNGDGHTDIAIAETGFKGNTGRAFVYYMSKDGLSRTPSVALDAPDFQGLFGYALTGVGDLNGDGFGDLIAGAPNTSVSDPTGDDGTDRAYLYFGSESGLTGTPDVIIDGPDGPNSLFGVSASLTGDIDGDAMMDLVVGADLVADDTGAAYVFAGNADRVFQGPRVRIYGPDGLHGRFGQSVARLDALDPGFGPALLAPRAACRAPRLLPLCHGVAMRDRVPPRVPVFRLHRS